MDKRQIYPDPYPTKVLGLDLEDIITILYWIREQGYEPTTDLDKITKCDIVDNSYTSRVKPDKRLDDYEI
jgi:hypothetical protein